MGAGLGLRLRTWCRFTGRAVTSISGPALATLVGFSGVASSEAAGVVVAGVESSAGSSLAAAAGFEAGFSTFASVVLISPP